MIYTAKDLIDVIKQGEGQTIEFKTSFQKEVIESVVAFANARGGKILVGVANTGSIIGIELSKESLQNWINQIKQNTSPSIIPDMEIIEIDGKAVIVIEIKEYPIKPMSYKNRYFVRRANSNHIMSLDEIANEHLKTINASWDYQIDERHNFKDISMDKAVKLIENIETYQKKKFPDDIFTILRKYELIKEDKLTFGAYLLFVDNVSALTCMDIGRFKSETTIIDSLSLSTDLLTEVEQSMTFIRKNLMVEYIITGEPQRTERYDYPLEAIREIVINMIVHRDYRDSGNSIIKIFDDCIEFFNPGKLYDDITIEKLQSGNYASRSRNRAIARIFKEAGIIERYGSGIKRIKDACKSYGIGKPVFEEFQHGFRVTLFKKRVNGGVNGGVNEIFDFIVDNPGYNAKKISERFGISLRTTERLLKQLKDKNKIEFKGSPKKGGYFIK